MAKRRTIHVDMILTHIEALTPTPRTHHIHRRCVPTAEFERAGLPARRLRVQA